jgi:methyl coenzyme M reductase subunit C-like uncharacterized protein (methanogenesis marker protein 7)
MTKSIDEILTELHNVELVEGYEVDRAIKKAKQELYAFIVRVVIGEAPSFKEYPGEGLYLNGIEVTSHRFLVAEQIERAKKLILGEDK